MEEGRTPRARGRLAADQEVAAAAAVPARLFAGLPFPAFIWPFLAFVVAGFLHTAAFPPFELPEAAYVFALPVLLWGLFVEKVRGEGRALFLAGFLSWATLLSWLRNVTDHLQTPLAGALGWFAVIALAAAVAVFFWFWGITALWMLRRVRGRPFLPRLGAMLALAGLWVVLEGLRGSLLTGFPWLPLAASQWQRALLLQVVSLGGAAGLSFVLIAFNLGLALYLHRLWLMRRDPWWKRLCPEFYLALALLFGSIAYGLSAAGLGTRERSEGPRLGFVQPAVGAAEKWTSALMEENLSTLADLSQYAVYLDAELILWPESPTPLPVKGNASMRRWTEDLVRATGRPLLMGNLAAEGSREGGDLRWYNAVFFATPEGGLLADRYYAKQHLVPFGEYVPLARWLPFLSRVVPATGDFATGEGAVPIAVGGPEESFPRSRVGPLICYEDIFPELARANVKAGADWHFVVTNNAWFGEEGGAYQHAAHSILRAVETRRPVVRCGNAGWSGWIDEYGQIRHIVVDGDGSIYFQGVDVAEFSLSKFWRGKESLYLKGGYRFPWICLGLVLAGGALAIRNPRGLP
ncbi:MAG: apolipoprotein N-acyltransferase [Verrucomicrobia bacterium]|jgi:apolipoprotein N-acyltransferase|nr:apolipoprotein N-acyltransferase [Verrucomicrobiota bacterium]